MINTLLGKQSTTHKVGDNQSRPACETIHIPKHVCPWLIVSRLCQETQDSIPHQDLLVSSVCICVSLTASVVSDSVTPWTVSCQVPLSMRFSRQEYWSGGGRVGSLFIYLFFKRILEWVAIPFSWGSPRVSFIAGRLFYLSHQGSPD